jgi:hypothetical protein
LNSYKSLNRSDSAKKSKGEFTPLFDATAWAGGAGFTIEDDARIGIADAR